MKRNQPRSDSTQPLPRTLWYMGAKTRVLPGFLDRILEAEVPARGTVVDLMCGTGVVSAYCARRYRVLAGDAQEYACAVARAWIEHEPATRDAFVAAVDPDRDLDRALRRNLRQLERRYAPALAREAELLESFATSGGDARWCGEYRAFLQAPGSVHADGSRPSSGRGGSTLYAGARSLLSDQSIAAYRADPDRRPACLVTAYYANIYFGLRQAMVIDSLRAAIDELPAASPFARQKRAHYLSALLHAASICTSGTSHFAQPRHLTKDSELRAMATRRRLNVLETFRGFSSEIRAAVRATCFQPGNRALAGDVHGWIQENGAGPRLDLGRQIDLVYLDPPYTADHYSRFYHVLEVLARHDYPPLETDARGRVVRGRYPRLERRFQSDFCRRSAVEGEFRRVIRAAAGAGAKLVISYSSPTGLLLKKYRQESRDEDPVARFEALCREAYRDVRTHRKPLRHSGQGEANLHIDELLVVCKGPRAVTRANGR